MDIKESNKKVVHLGLDLGVASVGWSIVDNEQNIIHTGAHLFKQASLENSKLSYGLKVRGEYRRARRLKRHSKQRRLDFLNLIDKYCFSNQEKLRKTNKLSSLYKPEYQEIFGFNENESSTDFLFNNSQIYHFDVYKIYEKAFYNELKPKELFLLLYWKLTFRGVFFKTPILDNVVDFETSFYKNILLNSHYNVNYKFRTKSNADSPFSIMDNWKDIEFILRKQSYITDEFIEDYKKIFLRRRDSSKGPGITILENDKLSPENYKKYLAITKNKNYEWMIKYKKDGTPEVENLWEYKISYCPISLSSNNGDKDKSEKCINNYFSVREISNFISQLIDIKIINSGNNSSLTKEQIITVLDYFIFKEKKSPTIEQISKLLNIEKDSFNGYPKDKLRIKSNFEKLKNLKRLFFDEEIISNLNDDDKSIVYLYDVINKIEKTRFYLLKKYFIFVENKTNDSTNFNNQNFEKCKQEQEIQELLNELKKYNLEINIDNLCNFNQIKNDDITGYGSFGFSCYNEHVLNFFNDNKRLNTFNSYFRDATKQTEKYKYFIRTINNQFPKYIPNKFFENQTFISPNVKNALIEAIKVINRILREYIYKNKWILKSIIIETTCEKESSFFKVNSFLTESKRERISKYQAEVEKWKNKAKKILEENKIEATSKNIKKVILWDEQKNCDAYNGKVLDIKSIEDWQIDHIIPESYSFNSAYDNLVVTHKNSTKSKELGSSFGENNMRKYWEDWYCPSNETKERKLSILESIKIKKFKNLTTNLDNLNLKDFINRNLSETSYAIRRIKDGLVYFIENQQNNLCLKNCDVRTISGFISQKFRKYMNLEKKNRDNSNHHSHDASIIALYSSLPNINRWYEFIKKHLSLNHRNSDYNFDFKILKKEFGQIKYKEKIDQSKCIFSAKKSKVMRLFKNITSMTNEEIWEIIKRTPSKKIFDKEKYQTYRYFNDQNKHRVCKISLVETKIDNAKTEDKLTKLFRSLHNSILEIKSKKFDILQEEKEIIKTIKLVCEENKILTNWTIILDLYNLIKYNPEIKKITKDSFLNIYFNDESMIQEVLDKFEKNNPIEDIKESFNNLVLNIGIPIFSTNNNIKTIKYLKYFEDSKYIPTYEFKMDQTPLKNSLTNDIFEFDKLKILSNKKCLHGHVTKFIVLCECQKNDKTKRYFLKINNLNQLIRWEKVSNSINDIKIIKIFQMNNLFLYNDDIWEISNFNIFNNKITLNCLSNKEKGDIEGTWKSLDDEIKTLIFNLY